MCVPSTARWSASYAHLAWPAVCYINITFNFSTQVISIKLQWWTSKSELNLLIGWQKLFTAGATGAHFLIEIRKNQTPDWEAPEQTVPKFQAWDKEASVIMYWLQNAMRLQSARASCFFSESSWYLGISLQTKIAHTKQGTLSVTGYCNLMTGRWLGLDLMEKLAMKCSDDAQLMKREEAERVFSFW